MELRPEPVGLGVPAHMTEYRPTPRGDKPDFETIRDNIEDWREYLWLPEEVCRITGSGCGLL